jgi:hypothetical protein
MKIFDVILSSLLVPLVLIPPVQATPVRVAGICSVYVNGQYIGKQEPCNPYLINGFMYVFSLKNGTMTYSKMNSRCIKSDLKNIVVCSDNFENIDHISRPLVMEEDVD